jgi:hypothetical protein
MERKQLKYLVWDASGVRRCRRPWSKDRYDAKIEQNNGIEALQDSELLYRPHESSQ